jgi:hypothetical protein
MRFPEGKNHLLCNSLGCSPSLAELNLLAMAGCNFLAPACGSVAHCEEGLPSFVSPQLAWG